MHCGGKYGYPQCEYVMGWNVKAFGSSSNNKDECSFAVCLSLFINLLVPELFFKF